MTIDTWVSTCWTGDSGDVPATDTTTGTYAVFTPTTMNCFRRNGPTRSRILGRCKRSDWSFETIA